MEDGARVRVVRRREKGGEGSLAIGAEERRIEDAENGAKGRRREERGGEAERRRGGRRASVARRCKRLDLERAARRVTVAGVS